MRPADQPATGAQPAGHGPAGTGPQGTAPATRLAGNLFG